MNFHIPKHKTVAQSQLQGKECHKYHIDQGIIGPNLFDHLKIDMKLKF
jgi:hypothetical protein